MNALEIAEGIESYMYVGPFDMRAAAMLRKQHEAIKMLREALPNIEDALINPTKGNGAACKILWQALKDTEEFQ